MKVYECKKNKTLKDFINPCFFRDYRYFFSDGRVVCTKPDYDAPIGRTCEFQWMFEVEEDRFVLNKLRVVTEDKDSQPNNKV